VYKPPTELCLHNLYLAWVCHPCVYGM